MVRGASILIAAWALVLLPAFCVAGLVPHVCDCITDDEPVSAPQCPHDQPDCSHDSNCNHESDCGSDPCADTVARAERQHDESVPLTHSCQAVLGPHVGEFEPAASVWIEANSDQKRLQLLVYRSDIPLLI